MNSNSFSRLALGTVQFGLPYGINNTNGKVNQSEIKQILQAALQSRINLIDTAEAYGNAEHQIGQFVKEHPEALITFNMVSKCYTANGVFYADSALATMRRLNMNQLYGYLLHDFSIVRNNKNYINEFLSLKNKCPIKKIGFSLYYTKDLEFLLDNQFVFDLIQIPFNIFDQRFAAYFSELKRRNIEIHSRSCFLQGLFFMGVEYLPVKLKPLADKVKAIQQVGILNSISVEALALGFNFSFPEIDRVIIGVNNFKNFTDNLNACNQWVSPVIITELRKLREDDEQLILPINW